MRLSAELFQQIVEALKSDSATARDKRTAPRVGLRAQVMVVPAPGRRAAPRPVRCRNLSASGIGLLHKQDMPAGTEFVVRLEAKGLSAAAHVLCTVVHADKISPDLFSIGARIVRVLSFEEAERMSGTVPWDVWNAEEN